MRCICFFASVFWCLSVRRECWAWVRLLCGAVSRSFRSGAKRGFARFCPPSFRCRALWLQRWRGAERGFARFCPSCPVWWLFALRIPVMSLRFSVLFRDPICGFCSSRFCRSGCLGQEWSSCPSCFLSFSAPWFQGSDSLFLTLRFCPWRKCS